MAGVANLEYHDTFEFLAFVALQVSPTLLDRRVRHLRLHSRHGAIH